MSEKPCGAYFFAFFENFFVPILTSGGLAAVTSSFFAALYSAFGKYDVVHIHAEGPAFFSWLPKMFGKRVVVTIHGIDWQREKWQSGLGSKFIHQGEKNAVKYADEVIVLSKGVQDYFKEVTVINYVNQKHWRRNIIHILHFRPGVDTLSTYVEKIRQLRTFTKYERSIPRTRSVKTAKEIIDLKLDLIVLGSDEIWNLCGSGYHPLKFGTGLENQRTIAYAPSVGAVTEETAVPEDVLSGLKHLDRISGRDVESLKFVERACGRKAEKMLDPTFLYNFDTDIERENIKPKPYRYILIYDCKLTEPMVKQLQEYAKKNDLKIIGAGDYKTFYDEGFIDLTPYEWVDLFRNAEKVITGTFHGTVFSIKYNKSVLCYPTEKNRINKIRSLLSDMKIASRLLEVGCEDDFIPLLDTPMDYTETRNYIAQKIQEADLIFIKMKEEKVYNVNITEKRTDVRPYSKFHKFRI